MEGDSQILSLLQESFKVTGIFQEVTGFTACRLKLVKLLDIAAEDIPRIPIESLEERAQIPVHRMRTNREEFLGPQLLFISEFALPTGCLHDSDGRVSRRRSKGESM